MGILASLTLYALTAVQAPMLADYLKAHQEDAGLAVGAENIAPQGRGVGLGRYDRKRVHVGALAVIVPLTMVQFDESLNKPANLYDGLPRDAKVLYLLSTLDAQQWRSASGKGIGLADLRGEQRDVFLSLLPKTMRWKKVLVSEQRLPEATVERGTVEQTTMRLRIERQLAFHVPLEGDEGSYQIRSTNEEIGEPGGVAILRDDAEDRETNETFGVEVRSTVPNVLKKGQLDTSALNQAVTLPATTTVGEALGRAEAATGKVIFADARIRGLSVTFPAGQARTGDLLDALALAVTGSYRRVDTAYLLVADVTGAGTRTLRLNLWEEELRAEVDRRKIEWRKGLATSGLASAVAYDPTDPLSPKEGLAPRIGKSPYDKAFHEFFPIEELSPEQRAYLDRLAKANAKTPIQRDRVGLETQFRYRFILPDGRPLQSEGYLGMDWHFRPRPAPFKPEPDPAIPIGVIPEGANHPLAVRLVSPEEAKLAVATARAFGFSELWVETDRSEVLSAAIAGGLPTRLFARPWALEGGKDQTVLGETGRSAAARLATARMGIDLIQEVRMKSWPRLGPILVEGDILSPFDPRWPSRRNALAALARTEGLAGVVLTEAMPHGYEAGDDTATVGGYLRPLAESWAFGYDERARLTFFRAKGVDPVDLSTQMLDPTVEMYAPFFPRSPDLPLPSVDTLYAEWTGFRAKANAAALADLRAALPSLPVLIDVRRAIATQEPVNVAALAPWQRGEAPPSYTDYQNIPDFEGCIRLLSAPVASKVGAMADFGNGVKSFAPLPQAIAFDLTRVSSVRWADLLIQWLVRSRENLKVGRGHEAPSRPTVTAWSRRATQILRLL